MSIPQSQEGGRWKGVATAHSWDLSGSPRLNVARRLRVSKPGQYVTNLDELVDSGQIVGVDGYDLETIGGVDGYDLEMIGGVDGYDLEMIGGVW